MLLEQLALRGGLGWLSASNDGGKKVVAAYALGFGTSADTLTVDLGSCMLRVAFVPLCFSGTDTNFNVSVGTQLNTFLDRAGLGECSDNIGTTIVPPSATNLSCDLSGAACDGKFDGLENAVANAGIDVTQFDEVYLLSNFDDFCDNDTVGFANGADMIWAISKYPHNFAHETGHILGLADEYCSQLAPESGGDPVDSRCNTGSPPGPPPPNFLGSDLGCDPRAGDCCEDCENYEVCCEGNKGRTLFGQLSSNCIMSYAEEDESHGYCDRCLSHIQNPPNARSAADPAGQAPLSCSFAHLGNTPMMRASLSFRPDGTFDVKSSSVGVGRLGLAPKRARGANLLEVAAPSGASLFSTHFDTFFTSADPKPKGIDFSGLVRDEATFAVRAPVPAGTDDLSELVLRATRDGRVVQTTLNGVAPLASAGADQTVECNAPLSAIVSLDASASADPDGDTVRYEWFGDATFSDTRAAKPSAIFGMGQHQVFVVASDGSEESAPDAAVITVRDTTPPVVGSLPPVAVASCGNEQSFTFTSPSATDSCSSNVGVAGKIVEKNGAAIPPIALNGGSASLAPGNYRIEWRATDAFGNSATSSQLLVVRPGLQVANSLSLRDNAKVFASPNVPGPAANSGTGLLELGVEARSGSLTSKGAISIRDRAFVGGNVLAAGSVSKSTTATVTGTSAELASVTLPNLPTLATFNGGTGSTTVSSGQQLTLSAGAHGAVTLNSGSILRLGPGDHRFTALTVNSSVTLLVSPTTRVFVVGALTFRSPFLLDGQSSALASVYLGLLTNGSVLIETAFNGTLLAPNASISFGIGSGTTHRGLFFARNIELRPGTIVECAVSLVPQ